eukprot:2994775-Rhodomonas_salina.1
MPIDVVCNQIARYQDGSHKFGTFCGRYYYYLGMAWISASMTRITQHSDQAGPGRNSVTAPS